MDLEMRPIAKEEYEKWRLMVERGYSEHSHEGFRAVRLPAVEMDRTIGAYEDGEMVGTTRAFSMEMTVPGARLPTAVVDMVAVLPTHRRRGILTRMTERQLRDVYERGDPLAALLAEESAIYGRFGYGVGSLREDWSIVREHTAFAAQHEPQGHLRFVERDEARKVFPVVFERAYSQRPGVIKISEHWWDILLTDPVQWRGGASVYFHIVYEESGLIDGALMYSVRDRTMIVKKLLAVTDAAYASLWRYCFGVDLVSSTRAPGRAVDEPLPWMLADPRRLQRSIRDHTWLRLVDVPAALSARSYAQVGRLVLEVLDTICPWNQGRFELEGSPDGAECRQSKAAPDIRLSAADLAATYLGAVGFRTLSSAGRVEEQKSGALERADSMFATRVQPWTPTWPAD